MTQLSQHRNNLLPLQNYKLALFDLDGTLINSANVIAQRDLEAVKRLQASGVRAALVTGRAYFAARDLVQQLSISTPSVFFSGGAIVDPRSAVPIAVDVIPTEVALEFVEQAEKLGRYAEIYTLNNYFASKVTRYTELHQKYVGGAPIITPLSEVAAREKVVKLELILDRGDEQILETFALCLPQLSFHPAGGAADPEIVFVNINSAAVSKEQAVRQLLSHIGIAPENTIAFGDSSSDIPMFRVVGTSIATGNSSTEVQNSATCVTKSVEECGVAEIIEMLLDKDS